MDKKVLICGEIEKDDKIFFASLFQKVEKRNSEAELGKKCSVRPPIKVFTLLFSKSRRP